MDFRMFAASDDTNAAARAERLRIAEIIESSDAKRNPELAIEVALRTTVDATTATAFLARIPTGLARLRVAH